VRCVNATREKQSNLRAHYNRFLFHLLFGRISLWTLLPGLPKLGNKSVIMVVVDRLSKYAHFCALQHPFTASTVAQIFMDQVFKLHGMPHSIVSDRDPTFTSNFWQEIFKLHGTQLHLSTAYHPQTDGQTKLSTSVWKHI
jgi:transposase InsO family protein